MRYLLCGVVFVKNGTLVFLLFNSKSAKCDGDL